VNRADLEIALIRLKRKVVRTTLRRKYLAIREDTIDRISLETSYATLESGQIDPESLEIYSLAGRLGRSLYRVTHFRCFRLLFRDPKKQQSID
jgi:hypothetical protein